jgi:predicted CopG family antitoxin
MYPDSVATKTISVDLEAYERLRRARLRPDESFSRVIERTRWDDREHNAARALLDALARAPRLDDATLEAFEAAQRDDAPSDAPWDD